ncbi:hypothetical protein D8674_036410 [Pyrus ussuriensis x Pyrus communis]|uniref:Uncharacterized protein n=1 Tax=Pyrus ussuriensis x Pyrus communis TaxID=2448454 RepID=A0A5N5GTP4_9ROSA|nr:hypothetical protein D8674_036410 [Pyrus ussuriensis x Pyrus communis]
MENSKLYSQRSFLESREGLTCEIKLDTRSSGWHKTMIKILISIRGVSYSIDAEAGMAYVAGTVDPNTLLTSFAKAGKHAQLLRVHSDSGHHRHHFSTSVGNSSTGNFKINSKLYLLYLARSNLNAIILMNIKISLLQI